MTDNDSAKMPTAHEVIQGYNAQDLVDDKHQIIIHAEAMGYGQDADNLSPMIDRAKENMQSIGKKETDCHHCPLRLKCLSRRNGKSRALLILLGYIENREKRFSLSQKMKEKIDSDEGKSIYSKRFAIIEPVFAIYVVKNNWIDLPFAVKQR